MFEPNAAVTYFTTSGKARVYKVSDFEPHETYSTDIVIH